MRQRSIDAIERAYHKDTDRDHHQHNYKRMPQRVNIASMVERLHRRDEDDEGG